jgi:cellulose synthase/poly-beta-1,6-N-acetylglucosamine synthase-like glycosyltransferase
MNKFFARNENQIQRLLEIFPGFTAWMIIIFPFWGSLIFPEFVAYVVLTFMAFWLYRSIVMGTLALRGFLRVREYKRIDWKKKFEKEERDYETPFSWSEIRHVVIIPNYNESVEVLRRSLDSLTAQDLDRSQLVVVLAMEVKAADHKQRAEQLLKEYQGKFGLLTATYHPPNLPGEVPGKSANERWAAVEIRKKLVDELGYDQDMITITSCDADARFNEKYFSCLNYKFLTDPNRYLRFWQSPIFEHNNIEEVPAFIRIVSVLGVGFHLSDIQEPRNLFINYSSYSTSLKLLQEVGYWDPDVIPEDWHIFLKSYFSLKGEVEVRPIFLPTNIDAPQAKTYLGSLINRYEQCKRHAWGVTLIPYVIKQFFIHPEIPLSNRVLRVFKVIESHVLWSVSWFFVTISATIPPLVNPTFEQTVLGQNLPRLSGFILTLTLVTLFLTIFIDAKLRPPSIKKTATWKKPFLYLEWFLIPVATLFMAALPGIHAQTRLMLGKYMEYRVTEKV